MLNPVLRVENLSKCYQIGRRQKNVSFRDAIGGAFTAPFRRWQDRKQTGGGEPFWAVKDVSFEVNRGEIVAVIGRNGAGKSTLLKILSRITEPTSGRAVMRGRVPFGAERPGKYLSQRFDPGHAQGGNRPQI
jgi:lipopolysaccharide transport system ATP-binding protein